MEKQTKSPKEIRQRKFMLVLPLLALPFMTMAFWALGGGKVNQAEAQSQQQAGFNLKLPGADFKEDKPMDKLGYYDQARQDSVRFLELMKNDPSFGDMAFSDTEDYLPDDMEEDYGTRYGRRGLNTSLHGAGGSSGDPNAEDRKSTRLNSSHVKISYAVFCLKKKKKKNNEMRKKKINKQQNKQNTNKRRRDGTEEEDRNNRRLITKERKTCQTAGPRIDQLSD